MDNWAAHYIMVDGSQVTYTNEHDAAYGEQSSSTSIVMHLDEGQEVTVDPNFTGTIRGNPGYMGSSFGITLLYRD